MRLVDIKASGGDPKKAMKVGTDWAITNIVANLRL
jgi:hypothetical protein